MTDYENVLACMPVDRTTMRTVMPSRYQAKLDEWTPSENSEQGSCDVCGCDVWVGPRIGLLKQIDEDATLMCLLCAAEMARRSRFHLVDMGEER